MTVEANGLLQNVRSGAIMTLPQPIDWRVPMLMRMYEKRVRGYKAIGYTIESK